MNIEKIKIADKIHLLVFDNQEDITSTFLRFQESYESPEFRGKYFSLDEFKKWYTKNSPNGIKTGQFTYYTDWSGFNIPSNVLKPFYEGKFDQLSKKEKVFLELFTNLPEPFYIIGVRRNAKKLQNYLKHETAHGLFYTDKDYRTEVLDAISRFNVEETKNELRSKAGYHEDVLDDEIQAYSIVTNNSLNKKPPIQLSKAVNKLFDNYSDKNDVRFPDLK